MGLSKLFLAALFLALTVTVANAYTIVMRDGRRVEIPNKFTVTDSTLTYEVGSGIQITIQLIGVDIAATERANGEPTGCVVAQGFNCSAQVQAQRSTNASAAAALDHKPRSRRSTGEHEFRANSRMKNDDRNWACLHAEERRRESGGD